MKTKILFLIHDIGHGGAEKVLVNLVNNMDRNKFDITLMAIFGGGINEQFIKKDIRVKIIFPRLIPGNSKIMKIFFPRLLHFLFIKERYDIEVAYLEGPDARIISGCPELDTQKVFWIHCTMRSEQEFAGAFRNLKEAKKCYSRFNKAIFVSEEVREAFQKFCPLEIDKEILYNTNESDIILKKSQEEIEDERFVNSEKKYRLIAVGKIEPVKGFDRLAKVHKRLVEEGYSIHTYILGEGQQQPEIERYIIEKKISDSFTFLGYQTNPYKYVAKSDLFVCSSYSEGFSTATTEALIVGTPVVTTAVSGMKEMLGKNGEYGIVTENSEEGLYEGIVKILKNQETFRYYKLQASIRGKKFSKEHTVKAVEQSLLDMMQK